MECANGQIGFGRRRRRRRRRDVTDVGDDAVDRNKVYEVSMSTIVKVAEEHVEGKPATWVEKGESPLDLISWRPSVVNLKHKL